MTHILADRTELLRLGETAVGQRIVLCQGHFNLIHPGHRRFLEHARSLGQVVVVALLSDATLSAMHPEQRFYPQTERAENLSAFGLVDHVVILDPLTIAETIQALRPAVLLLGTEFAEERAPEVAEVTRLTRSSGGEVVFHSGAVSYSGEDLLARPLSGRERERRIAFRQSCDRQGIDLTALGDDVRGLRGRRLLVIGDTIVDQYVACDALGMSAEAPVVALKELRSREYVGGAAIVAAHVQALGGRCSFLSVTGDDDPARFVARELAALGVEAHLLVDSARPTTFKIRYMVGNQKLLRVSRLEQTSIPQSVEEKLIDQIEQVGSSVDGIIVSDFVYGVVTRRVLAAVSALSARRSIPVFGDLQCSSQVGSCLRFSDFSIITPNEREARIALGDNESGLEKIAQKLLATTRCDGLLLTLGPGGFIAYDTIDGRRISESFPALDPNPVDVTGAGDALLAAVALGRAAGWPLMKAAAVGACVGALAVGRLGNTPITSDEVVAYLVGESQGRIDHRRPGNIRHE